MPESLRLYKFPTVTLWIIGLNVLAGLGIVLYMLLAPPVPYDSAGACIQEKHPECVREATQDELRRCTLHQLNSDKGQVNKCLVGYRDSCRHNTDVVTDCFPAASQITTNYGFAPGEFSFQNSFTILTAMFIHGGVLHLFFNMLILFFTGIFVEARIHHLKYLSLYLLSGIGGHILYAAFNLGSTTPAVGASGAVYGILGAAFVLRFYDEGTQTYPKIGSWVIAKGLPTHWLFNFLFLAVLNSLYFAPLFAGGTTAHSAHLGGAIIGVIAMTFMIDSSEKYQSVPDG